MNHENDLNLRDIIIIIATSILFIIIATPVLTFMLKHQPKVTENIKIVDKKVDIHDSDTIPYIIGKTKDDKTVKLNTDIKGSKPEYDFEKLKKGKVYKITYTKYIFNITGRKIATNIADS